MPLLTVKEAVSRAKQYASDILDVTLDQLLLEEVELTEDQQFWRVTVSIAGRDVENMSGLRAVLGGMETRTYKIVQLQADTGNFVSLKIRKL